MINSIKYSGVKKKNYLIDEGTSPRNIILRMMIEVMIQSEESALSLDGGLESGHC